MTNARILINVMIFTAALAVSGTGCADEEDNPGVKTVMKSPDAVDLTVEPGIRRQICVSHLLVDKEGAHLRFDQVIVLIGPLPHDGSYLVFAAKSGSSTDLAWDSNPLIASDTGLTVPAGQPIYMMHPVKVLEDPGEHPAWTDHPMNMVIRETEDGCPTFVEIRAYRHSGTLGFHGGVAHAKN